MDWPVYCQQMLSPETWLAEVTTRTLDRSLKMPNRGLMTLLEQTPVENRLKVITEHVKEQLSQTLGLPIESMDDQQGLFEMGMDSLMALEIKNRLQASLGDSCVLPSTLLFSQANVSHLSHYLNEKLQTIPTLSPNAGADIEKIIARKVNSPL